MPTLRTNDAELFYEEAGTGEPVLLLHGLGSSTLDWAPQIDALRGSHRVIALDVRGSGRSRDLLKPGGPFSVAQFAADESAGASHDFVHSRQSMPFSSAQSIAISYPASAWRTNSALGCA